MNQLQLICSIKSNVWQSDASNKNERKYNFSYQNAGKSFEKSFKSGILRWFDHVRLTGVRGRRGLGISDSKHKISVSFLSRHENIQWLIRYQIGGQMRSLIRQISLPICHWIIKTDVTLEFRVNYSILY